MKNLYIVCQNHFLDQLYTRHERYSITATGNRSKSSNIYRNEQEYRQHRPQDRVCDISKQLSHVLEIGTASSEQKMHFHVSGNCLLDGKNSYFSIQLKTNKWTSCLSGDISSLFKRLTISLPSSGNQILEDIQEYNVLSSMIQYMSGSDEDLETNWYSGQSSMVGNTREENMETSRLELSWNPGTDGWRTYTFSLNLSGLLQHSLYLPLFLLNGIKIDLTMSSALEALHWDPSNENDWESVLRAVNHRFPLSHNKYLVVSEFKCGTHSSLTCRFFEKFHP